MHRLGPSAFWGPGWAARAGGAGSEAGEAKAQTSDRLPSPRSDLLPCLPRRRALARQRWGRRGRLFLTYLCPSPPAPSAFLKGKTERRWGCACLRVPRPLPVLSPQLPVGRAGVRGPVPWDHRCLRKKHRTSVARRARRSGSPTSVPRKALFHGEGAGKNTSAKHPQGVVSI